MGPDDDQRTIDPKRGEIGSGSLPAWKWTGAEIPQLLHDLNESCLAALQKLAQGDFTPPGGIFECVNLHRQLWLDLDELSLQRAARAPCLLVDVHFQSEEWWRWARGHRAMSFKGVPSATFPPKAARELMTETLVLAWHTARSDRPTATLLLGISPAVTGRIAALSSRDVRRIAAEHCRELRPRFEGNFKFWQNLLLAACSGDAEFLSHTYCEGIQLLATEVLPGVR
jgi:hypothetical protein